MPGGRDGRVTHEPPEEARGRVHKGSQLQAEPRSDAEVKRYDRALQVEPDDPRSRFARGRAHSSATREQMALSC